MGEDGDKHSSDVNRPLQDALDAQVQRTNFFTDLVRLLSSPLPVRDLLEQVARRSTDVLGQTALIVLHSDGKQRLETAFSKHADDLTRLLPVLDVTPESPGPFLSELVERESPVFIEDLQQSSIGFQRPALFQECRVLSLIAIPIRAEGGVFGAFISMSSAPRRFNELDLGTAMVLSDFIIGAVLRARLLQQRENSSLKDAATGVYNPGFFRETLIRETARSDRYDSALSLLISEIDQYKAMSDKWGADGAQRVWTQIARLIESSLRHTDFFCRAGDDAFGVILPATSLNGALRAAEKIIKKVNSTPVLEALGYEGQVRLSAGAAEYRKGSPFQTLIAEAQEALRASRGKK